MRIGVDLGGTKTEALAMDDQGFELDRIRVSTIPGDYEATLRTIASLVLELEARTGKHASVGVGIPGTVAFPSGLVKNANSLWLNDRPLQRDLGLQLGREVRCANDANCFAISEATDGAAKDFAVVFGVILGTGCGGGVAVRGQLLTGPNGIAGEWGHTPLPWTTSEETPGQACYCGRNGCMETWVSGTGFEMDYFRHTEERIFGRDIATRAKAGDTKAQAAIRRLQDRLARGLAVVADVLDPDVFVLGGGLSQIEQLYDGTVEQLLSSYVFGGNGRTPVLKNAFGDSSGVRGAAWLWPAGSRPDMR